MTKKGRRTSRTIRTCRTRQDRDKSPLPPFYKVGNHWIPAPHLHGDRLRVNDGPPSGGANPLQPDRVTKYN